MLKSSAEVTNMIKIIIIVTTKFSKFYSRSRCLDAVRLSNCAEFARNVSCSVIKLVVSAGLI